MSQKEKLLAKLTKKPSPKDFSWNELVRIMSQYDFVESCNGGSHYTFMHSSGVVAKISKTHPSGILKKYQIEAAIEALRTISKNGEIS